MRSKQAGFTLIELLVAISILAIVAVLGFRGLDSLVRTRSILTADLEQTRNLQVTFAQLQSDFSQVLNPLSYPNLPEGNSTWVEPQRVILIRSETEPAQAPTMSVVAYRLKEGSLTRFESDSTRDLEKIKGFLEQVRGYPDGRDNIVMLPNVQEINLESYQPPQQKKQPVNERPDTNAAPGSGNSASDSKSGGSGNPASPGGAPGRQPEGGNIQNVDPSKATTGVKLTLKLLNHDKKIYKIFMIGGA